MKKSAFLVFVFAVFSFAHGEFNSVFNSILKLVHSSSLNEKPNTTYVIREVYSYRSLCLQS